MADPIPDRGCARAVPRPSGEEIRSLGGIRATWFVLVMTIYNHFTWLGPPPTFGKGEVESSIPSSSTSGVIGLFPKVAFSFYGEGGQRHPVEWPDKTRHSGRRRINRRLVG
jgi:hypothetical protein